MSTSRPDTVSPKLRRIAELARSAPNMVLTTLAHHIDLDWLAEAFHRTRKDGAVGVDGRTAKAYQQNLWANLQSLLDRLKSGTYRAPPVRRVHIPKGDGSKTRPIGIPTFEDKVLQRAVAMALEAVYEQDFLVRIPANAIARIGSLRSPPLETRSERSDGEPGLLAAGDLPGPHRPAFEVDLVRVVHHPIEDGVGDGGLAEVIVPVYRTT